MAQLASAVQISSKVFLAFVFGEMKKQSSAAIQQYMFLFRQPNLYNSGSQLFGVIDLYDDLAESCGLPS